MLERHKHTRCAILMTLASVIMCMISHFGTVQHLSAQVCPCEPLFGSHAPSCLSQSSPVEKWTRKTSAMQNPQMASSVMDPHGVL